MSEILKIIEDFKKPCPCGIEHSTAVKDVRIASGLVHKVGEILSENGFEKKLLLVADKNTLKAADGIVESLSGYDIEYHIYDTIRVATMDHVRELEEIIGDRDISVLSVGTGSVNDPCRLAAANKGKKLCIFATAPSMDGFASDSSPIVDKGFKFSYPAKSPEVIIGDTRILAAAPSELKSAGFGDMIAKYVAIIDWRVSELLTDEVCCDRVCALTREAVDELMSLADKVCENDEHTAGKIFEALLKTGIGMSFTHTSRPASGAEHVISHLLECVELRDGIIPNYHGDDVGVATLTMLKFYNELAEHEEIDTDYENVNWNEIYSFFGSMEDDARRANEPDNIIDKVDPKELKARWNEIRDIIHSVPSYEECYEAMRKAGCKLTVADIGKDEELFRQCTKYSPYMRRRLTILRMKDMIKTK